MNSGICVCVLLAVLSTSCLGRPASGSEDEGTPAQLGQSLSAPRRTARSAPPHGQPQPFQRAEEAAEQRASLGELLARLLNRKGSFRRNSTANSKASGLSANHRIKDRDYLGWMDFGRRSAEEYEYSS
ncbi:cholecystokinin a [Lepisosteus oculatus]|uniref:Cholecystokinin a n=1 Tax=Lepisosteus oculatus TaxID=7918 RepID=W5LZE1_LEPOC|nr:PREDICTED: cholecystokinin [Lepisosteus oculatus]